MLKTRIPRGRGVRRFAFLLLTGDEIETLESVPTVDAMATRIRRLKRAPLDPTGFLFT